MIRFSDIIKAKRGIPISRAFKSEIVPIDHVLTIGSLADNMKNIYISTYNEYVIDKYSGKIELTLKFTSEVVFELVGLTGFLFVFGKANKEKRVKTSIEMNYDAFRVTFDGGLKIRFSKKICRPAKKRFGKWMPGNKFQYTEIAIDKTVVIDHNWNIDFQGENEFSFGPAIIGGNGIICQGKVACDFSENRSIPESKAAGLDKTWRGIMFKTLKIHSLSNSTVSGYSGNIKSPGLGLGPEGLTGDFRNNPNLIPLVK